MMLFRTGYRHTRRTHLATPAVVEQLEMRTLLSAGALDESFGGDGLVTTSLNTLNTFGSMHIRPDGKIVVLGTSQTSGGFNIEYERVMLLCNPDGSLDGSFGRNGVARVELPLEDASLSLATTAFLPDGKILVGGLRDGVGSDPSDFAVARINADGTLDTSFGVDGYASVSIYWREGVTDIAVQSDGKIILAGYTTLPTPPDPRGRQTFVAIRLSADGSLDTSFGDSGHTIVDAITGVPQAMGIQGNDKIVLAGGNSVVRLMPDGRIDPLFGVVMLDPEFDAKSLAIVGKNRVLIAGTAKNDDFDFEVVQLGSVGNVVGAFGRAGYASIGFAGDSDLNAMAVQADGRILLAGWAHDDATETLPRSERNTDFAVARLNADGSPDRTFADNGKLRIPVDAGTEQSQVAIATTIAIQPDGRIVVGGDSYEVSNSLLGGLWGPYAIARILSGNEPSDFELIGRASDGDWWVSGFTNDGGELQSRVLSHWAPSVDWKHVRTGDFDGDGLNDIAGWNPAGGNWWVSLADGDGSTVKFAGHWSDATSWFDVASVDLAAARDRVEDGYHFTHKSDLVGRDQWGNWWAAVANGNGTFSNVLLATWNAAAGWSGTQFLDVNADGQPDIVSQTAGGDWWGLISRAPTMSSGLVYDTVKLASWVGNAGWHDVVTSDGLFGDDQVAIAARTSGGAWWALDFAADGTVTTRSVAKWNEAGGWRDVQTADLDGDGHDEIVGRTSTGEWWSLAFDAITGDFASRAIGGWNESVGWHDVQAMSLDGHDVLVGRNNFGDWWLSEIAAESGALADRLIGHWNPQGNWRDVHNGDFTRVPVELLPPDSGVDALLKIYGDRAGTYVITQNDFRFNGDAGSQTGLRIWRQDENQQREWFFATNTPTSILFEGHIGDDTFIEQSNFGWTFVGRGGKDYAANDFYGPLDEFFGRDGLDTLLGNGSDVLV